MRRGPTWIQLAVAMAVGIAVLVASPALGGPSLKLLVKKQVQREVSRQLSTATGPQGSAGPAGTARAYARVLSTCDGAAPHDCTFDRQKGIASVTRVATGVYCVTAPGIDPAGVPAAVTIDESPEDDADHSLEFANLYGKTTGSCGAAAFTVITHRISFGVAQAYGEDQAIPVPQFPPFGQRSRANDVAFTIVIP